MAMSTVEQQAIGEVGRLVRHIADQIEKRQYWNALSASLDVTKNLAIAFNEVLKGRATMLLFLVLASTACGLDDFRIVNTSPYPTSYGKAIVASVRANAAPDLVLDSWELYMRGTLEETETECPPTLWGCVRPLLEHINVLFDPNLETPWTHPSVEGWIVDTTCHELGHVYLRQTVGDSGIRYDENGVLYHESEGVFGEWFGWPRQKCLAVIDEFGGFGDPLPNPNEVP